MRVQKDGLIKIISRKYRYYSRKQIAEIIEREGAEYFFCNIEYIGFGIWEIH